jgi:hypothetical protein
MARLQLDYILTRQKQPRKKWVKKWRNGGDFLSPKSPFSPYSRY